MKKPLWAAVLFAATIFAAALLRPSRQAKAQGGSVTLVGAGDIADGFNLNLGGAVATAALLNSIPGTVFADGDLAYNNGTDGDFAKSYDPTWGIAKSRTIPVPGNHEYTALNAVGYFSYFGSAAGDPTKGYFSLNLGAWHVVVLNSNCTFVSGGCGAGSPQEVWLRNDLAANTQVCTLALWHHPLFTSVAPGQGVTPATNMQTIWQDLFNANADLVVNGHAHNYERFAPQNGSGGLDTARGIIEIVAGTGGESHMTFGTIQPNSIVQDSTTFGVLKLTLNASSFSWQFMPVPGGTFTDSGTQNCH